MPIKINNATIRAGRHTIKFKDFPEHRAHYHRTRPATRGIEKEGAQLIKARAPDDARVYRFVLSVFRWGGRTSGRVKNNLIRYHGGEKKAAKALAKGIRSAIPLLKSGKCADALDAITGIRGMGISYGSKILRMLAPEKAVVYDSILRGELNYDWNSAGYQEFCNHCRDVAKKLRGSPGWKAADVEAVIFAVIFDNLDE